MKTIDHIEAYKLNNKNTFEHVFKDGSKFKGGNGIKMHEFLDQLHKDLSFEYKTQGTKNTLLLIQSLLKL